MTEPKTLAPEDLSVLFDALEIMQDACERAIAEEQDETNPDESWIKTHREKAATSAALQEALYNDDTVSGRATWTLLG